jgi:hypothetical protein
MNAKCWHLVALFRSLTLFCSLRVLLTLNFFHVVVLQESLLAMSKLREEVDLEKSRAKWDSADRDKDLKICIRAKNNAWVIARTPLMPLRGSAIASPVLKVTALSSIYCVPSIILSTSNSASSLDWEKYAGCMFIDSHMIRMSWMHV